MAGGCWEEEAEAERWPGLQLPGLPGKGTPHHPKIGARSLPGAHEVPSSEFPAVGHLWQKQDAARSTPGKSAPVIHSDGAGALTPRHCLG